MRLLLFTNAAGLSARHVVLLARNPAYRDLPGGRKGAGQLIGIRPAVGKLVSMFAYSKTKYSTIPGCVEKIVNLLIFLHEHKVSSSLTCR